MSKKIILNDNEVAHNEDVSSAQNWRSQDLNRALEALFGGTFASGSVTPGNITAGAILAGATVSGSSTTLSVNVAPGVGIFSFGGDLTFNNRYRLASLDATLNLALPLPHSTLYRWDLVEVSAEEITTSETRKVLTYIGPRRELVNTVVPKTISSNLKFRVRSGAPSALSSARLPALQPDNAWLPVAGVLVSPGSLTTFGSQILDLRKVLSYCSPMRLAGSNGNQNGFDRDVSLSSHGTTITMSQNWVRMGGYHCPIQPSAQHAPPDRPLLDVNIDKPSGLVLLPDKWFYIYAYRPTANCGHTSLVLTDVAPIHDDSEDRGKPSSAFPLPTPWPTTDTSSPAQYVASVRLYESGGTFYSLPFRKQGGYTTIYYQSVGLRPGANTEGNLHAGSGSTITSGPVTVTVSPDGNGNPGIPQHSSGVRLQFQVENTSGPVPIRFSVIALSGLGGVHDFSIYTTYSLDVGDTAAFELDVPLPNDDSTEFEITPAASTNTVTWRSWVQGFYEEMP